MDGSNSDSDNSLESFASDGKSVDAGDIGDINNDDLVDELDDGDLEIKQEDESDCEELIEGANLVYVGPPKSKQEDKRKWEVHTVDTDPSLFSTEKSYRRDPEVIWNPLEEKGPKEPLNYMYKAFPMTYISTILDVTNAKLTKISKIKPFDRSDFIRMIGIRLALTLDSKKGGLNWEG